ncbi:thiamine phosphate synthase [Aeromicrobium sp. CF4.19]|uniref:thiamine phosphate synthase n=1 Tax=Aeromicrobium sp. CF4.19 TaxID=3373082 RepID=UPI003EE489A3
MSGNELRNRLDAARLYLCTDASAGERATLDLVRMAVEGGVDVVQLRDKTLSTRDELALLESVREVCVAAGALFAVNDRADVARIAGAQVFHTGQDDLPIEAARSLLGEDVLLGRSTHSAEQAMLAAQDPDIDYFCIGPVWETPTKPGRPAAGVEAVRHVAASDPATPWFAIGGIDLERLSRVLDAGARRIVVVRAITRADDPRAAAAALRAAVS